MNTYQTVAIWPHFLDLTGAISLYFHLLGSSFFPRPSFGLVPNEEGDRENDTNASNELGSQLEGRSASGNDELHWAQTHTHTNQPPS